MDGSLGKHNGTINGKTYFHGMERRCDMIRANKIRSKANPTSIRKVNKYNSPPRADRIKYVHHRHKRANSDLSDMHLSMADLSNNFSDNYFKKKNFNDAYKRKLDRENIKKSQQKKHIRSISQQPQFGKLTEAAKQGIQFVYVYCIYCGFILSNMYSHTL